MRRIGTLRKKQTQQIRNKIYDYLSSNPGISQSKLAEMLDMGTSSIKYHLDHLQKNDLILAVRDKNFYCKRYYIKNGCIGNKDREILSLLRQKYILDIVLILNKGRNLTHKEILRRMGMTLKSKLSYHLAKLVESGLVDVSTYGKEKGYCLKNRTEINRILDNYILNIESKFSRDHIS